MDKYKPPMPAEKPDKKKPAPVLPTRKKDRLSTKK